MEINERQEVQWSPSPENNKKEARDFYLFKKVSTIDKYNFFEYLWVLIDGGVNISESIESTAQKIKNPYFQDRIRELSMFVQSGDPLSKSMKKLPQVFESGEISIIEAWEQTGSLTTSLFKLSEELRKTYALKQKVKGALTYPIIIFLFLFLSVIIVLTYVIPAIKPLFETAGVELPFATKALIVFSDFIRFNFLGIGVFAFMVFVLIVWWKGTEKWKASIDNFLLNLPLVGVVYRNYILSKVSSNLWVLVGSGVNIIKALTLVGKTTQNSIYEALFLTITDKVSKGNKITDSMKEVDPHGYFFPNDFVQMLGVGEKTANLEKVSQKINDQYTREVDYSLANLTKWIEPIAILLAGVFVLWFAFAIFGAILKVTQTVS
jgi:type IV pilus assembly protein PilC